MLPDIIREFVVKRTEILLVQQFDQGGTINIDKAMNQAMREVTMALSQAIDTTKAEASGN